MRYQLFCLLALLHISWSTQAQIYDPVSWQTYAIHTGDDTYDLIFEATIQKNWYIYSQYLESEDGPIPTSFNYEDESHFDKVGRNEECNLNRLEVDDHLFNMKLVKFKSQAFFRQSIKAEQTGTPIVGWLEFMTCDDQRCLPPAMVDFEIDLSKAIEASAISYSQEQLCSGHQSFNATMNPSEEGHSSPSKSTGRIKPSSPEGTPSTGSQQSAKVRSKPVKEPIVKAIKKQETSQESIEPADASSSINLSNIDVLMNDALDHQIEDPVQWSIEVQKIDDDVLEIALQAVIEDGWHIYSHELDGGGPIPTSFHFMDSSNHMFSHPVIESGTHIVTEIDQFFDQIEVTKLKETALYQLRMVPKDQGRPVIGYLEYMACTNDKCLPAQIVDFSVDPRSLESLIGVGLLDGDAVEADVTLLEQMFGLDYSELQAPVGACVESISETRTLSGIFVLGFIGGLIALLTPCVFPMIPLTVSFFTKSNEKKGKGLASAFFYGFSILLVYLLLSLPFHLLDSINPNILNDISTNVWLNILFFVIFVFFALSFFGYFDLTLPAGVTNKISAAEGIGGALGIFFMALTLALVSFSCTGPILGSLLAGSLSSEGGAWQLTSGFAGFGLALGLPFGLFAAFPGMMKSLPKSGGWLNTVKVVLGFIELALAFKFLSNADLVKQWGLLKIEPFLIIWIVIAIALALYLLGKIKFPHDSPLKGISITRWGLAGLSMAFAIYLITGFRYNEQSGSYQSLSLLSGLAPPVCYSILYDCKCPQGLECFKDLKEGLTYAKSVNKPVLLDFTGHACVNCRKMEENVWPQKEVYPYLKNDYVLISLYVDEKKELPKEEQVTLERRIGGPAKMRYTGNRWAFLQSEYFNINSQPYYVLITPDGRLLNNPVAYTPDKHAYAEFLDCGLRNFKQIGMK